MPLFSVNLGSTDQPFINPTPVGGGGGFSPPPIKTHLEAILTGFFFTSEGVGDQNIIGKFF